MIIDRYGAAATDSTKQVDSSNVQKQVSGTSQTGVQAPATEDSTTFSSSSHSVYSLTQAALEAVPSRQVKVEALKQAVSSAQYQLDSDKIAESLVNADV